MTTIPVTTRPTRPALAALLLSLVLTGCAGAAGGDDGVATAGEGNSSPGASASPAAKLTDDERRLKFAECMRSNGVPMDDPGRDGGRVRLRVGGDTTREDVQAAMQKCKAYAPNGGEPLKLDAAQLAKLREFARCMRANGVPDFPDPDPSGRVEFRRYRGVDPDDEAFRKAGEKCRQFRPQLRPGAPR
jgi:hypothetical protein